MALHCMSSKLKECIFNILIVSYLTFFFVMWHSWNFIFQNKNGPHFLIKYLIILCHLFHWNVIFKKMWNLVQKGIFLNLYDTWKLCMSIFLRLWLFFWCNPTLNVPLNMQYKNCNAIVYILKHFCFTNWKH
jgi:hypothetical protein